MYLRSSHNNRHTYLPGGVSLVSLSMELIGPVVDVGGTWGSSDSVKVKKL